jgi:hypothetical protein
MSDEEWSEGLENTLKLAALIATVLGVLVVSYFLVIDEERYSALYLVPDPSVYTLEGDIVSFTYGITCIERGRTTYLVEIYAGDTLAGTRTLDVGRGETLEQQANVQLPSDATYPFKVKVDARADSGSTESVHFWVRERTE